MITVGLFTGCYDLDYQAVLKTEAPGPAPTSGRCRSGIINEEPFDKVEGEIHDQ
jgi:hypothetical protein